MVRSTRRSYSLYSITSALEYFPNGTKYPSSSSLTNTIQHVVEWMDLQVPQPSDSSNVTFMERYNKNINSYNISYIPSNDNDRREEVTVLSPPPQQQTSTTCMTRTMPLYPVPSVTVPDITNLNVTFWNVERRNIQMVLDLEKEEEEAPPLVCVVLQAKDTGRIASVGTVVRIRHVEKEMNHDHATTRSSSNINNSNENSTTTNYRRMIVTCVPVGIATRIGIINPVASTQEHRFRYPDEYIRADVQYQPIIGNTIHPSPTSGNDTRIRTVCDQIRNDWKTVFSLYVNNSAVTRNWPPIMISRMQSIAESDDTSGAMNTVLTFVSSEDQVLTTTEFWSMVQLWQSLCDTVRTVYDMILMADRNEYMVEAAIRNGNVGPLQLPIHMEDLLPSDRRYMEQMERNVQQQWTQLQLDPCIDFQILLSLPNDYDRFYYLSQMIARERQRLQNMIHPSTVSDTTVTSRVAEDVDTAMTEMDQIAPIRKGAWFNDDYW